MNSNEGYFVDVSDLSFDVFDVLEQDGAVTALTADHGRRRGDRPGRAARRDGPHRRGPRDLVRAAAAKRAQPAEDLISRLATAEVDGGLATVDEIASLSGLILLTGHVTTHIADRRAAVHELCVRPELDSVVRAHDRVDDLVLEALRTAPPSLR
ncbi:MULTISPECIES: hypothetical protein [unclassified Streptomyces]|uniref:hypothetical protein n=1 Tax=unclassified Streptomyces TaxID=2593676 RepID=UPI002E159F8E|nr:hypothetical protein OG452_01480 [Streptomyces sp. NBC_01197]WSS53142.1 hypothetical protein OG708_33585 [Streptomyces sp. NBC_01180]